MRDDVKVFAWRAVRKSEEITRGADPRALHARAGRSCCNRTALEDHRMSTALVLAITAEHADAILAGTAKFDHRALPPRRLPATAYLAVVGADAVVGECELDAPTRRSAKGWALPVRRPRRYRAPRPLTDFGLTKAPRSFRYLTAVSTAAVSSPGARRTTRA
jgi:predicted transcriptional regulator